MIELDRLWSPQYLLHHVQTIHLLRFGLRYQAIQQDNLLELHGTIPMRIVDQPTFLDRQSL